MHVAASRPWTNFYHPDTAKDLPPAIVDLGDAEHHVERVFSKRKRDRAEPEALALRPRGERGDRHD